MVKSTLEWKAPARYRDQLEVSVRVTHMGNTSFSLSMDFHNLQTSQFLARGEMVGAAVNAETVEKIPIADAMREVLKGGGQGQYIDHAGIHSAPKVKETSTCGNEHS